MIKNLLLKPFYYVLNLLMTLSVKLLFLSAIIINPFGIPIFRVIYNEIKRIEKIFIKSDQDKIYFNECMKTKIFLKLKLSFVLLKFLFLTLISNVILSTLIVIIQILIPHRIFYLLKIYDLTYCNQTQYIQEIFKLKILERKENSENCSFKNSEIKYEINIDDQNHLIQYNTLSNFYISDIEESISFFYYRSIFNYGLICIIKRQVEVMIYDYSNLRKLIIVHLMIFRCIHFWHKIIEINDKCKLRNINGKDLSISDSKNDTSSIGLSSSIRNNFKKKDKNRIKFVNKEAKKEFIQTNIVFKITNLLKNNDLNASNVLCCIVEKEDFLIFKNYSDLLDQFSNQIIYNYECFLFPFMIIYCFMCILSPLRLKRLISVHKNNSFVSKSKALIYCYFIVLTDYLCFILTFILLISVLSTYDTVKLMYYYISKELYGSCLYYDLNYLKSYKSELLEIFKRFLIKVFLIILSFINLLSIIRTKDLCFRLFRLFKKQKNENYNFLISLVTKNLSYVKENDLDIAFVKDYFKETVIYEWNKIKSNLSKLNSPTNRNMNENEYLNTRSISEKKEKAKVNSKKISKLLKLNYSSIIIGKFPIPFDFMIKITSYLKYDELINFSSTCSAFYILFSLDKVWKNQHKYIINKVNIKQDVNNFKNVSSDEKYVYFNFKKDRLIKSAIEESDHSNKNKTMHLVKIYSKINIVGFNNDFISEESFDEIIGYKGIIFEESLKLYLTIGHLILIPLKLISNFLKFFGDIMLVFFMFIESVFLYEEINIYKLDIKNKKKFLILLQVLQKINDFKVKVYKENWLNKEDSNFINKILNKELTNNLSVNEVPEYSCNSKSLFVLSERKNKNISSFYDELSSSFFSIFSNTITPKNKEYISDSLNMKNEKKSINQLMSEIYFMLCTLISKNAISLSKYYRISLIDEAVNKFNFVENIMVKDSFLSDLQIIGIIGILRFIGLSILFLSYSFFMFNLKILKILMHQETNEFFENEQIFLTWKLREILKYSINDNKIINRILSSKNSNLREVLQNLVTSENIFIPMIKHKYSLFKSSTLLSDDNNKNIYNGYSRYTLMEKIENNSLKLILNQLLIFGLIISMYIFMIISPFFLYFYKDGIIVIDSFLNHMRYENVNINNRYNMNKAMKLMINEFFNTIDYNKVVYLVLTSIVIWLLLYHLIIKKLHRLFSLSKKSFIFDLVVSLLYFDINQDIKLIIYKITEFILFPQTILIIICLKNIKNSNELKLNIYYFILMTILAIHPLFLFKILKYTIINISLLVIYFIMNLMLVIKKA